MAQRIVGWGRNPSFSNPSVEVPASTAAYSVISEVPTEEVVRNVEPVVSANIIDQAVEDAVVTMGLSPELSDAMRRLLSDDMQSGSAHAYYTSPAARAATSQVKRSGRRELVLNYVLTDEQMAILTEYAPEYRLTYRARDVHDHPLAAASRMVDRDIVLKRFPLMGQIVDVGGAVLQHVASGLLGKRVHACRPVLDKKDSARVVQEDMKVRRILEKVSDGEVRDSAEAYLRGDGAAVCRQPVQSCDWRAPFISSVHVYDIPMGDWAAIIEKHGAKVVEGCILFSPGIFDQREGVMKSAGARYEVVPEQDLFRMGFLDSPAWWYSHKWSEYMKYGVDQVLVGEKATYSYKVVERRGDTLFFRILPVAGVPKPDTKQLYVLPGVPMVDVSGFSVVRDAKRLSSRRQLYTWPRPLWEDMLTHAMAMVDRGVLDYERLFGHYRSVAPRKSINAVVVAGGHDVPIGELVALVSHVALAAVMETLKTQAEIAAHVDSEYRARNRLTESTVYKMFAALGSSILRVAGVFVYPFSVASNLVSYAAETLLSRGMMDWEPQISYRNVSAKLILSAVPQFAHDDSFVMEPVDVELHQSAPFDHMAAALRDKDLATQLLASFYDDLSVDMLRQLEDVAGHDAVNVTLGDDGVAKSVEVKPRDDVRTAPPSYRTGTDGGVVDVVAERVMAVKEAIVQCEIEMKAVEASLTTAWRELVRDSRPRVEAMKARAEEFRDPMFWWVQNGRLIHSVLRPNDVVERFEHSAVFSIVPDVSTQSSLRPVFEEEFVGVSEGVEVRRTYYVVSDSQFTGWVMTNASVVVYNGPELISAMQLALTKDMDFDTRLVRGPPGCGKTYQICQEVVTTDVVLAPVRKVIADTRASVAAKSASLAAVASERCRTTDSYLVNYTVSHRVKEMSATRLLADEAFMAHSGRWWACAALLGVREVIFFGDPTQIPPVVRAGAPKMFLQVKADTVVDSWKTYRCPASAVAAWGGCYDWKVRTVSRVDGHLAQYADYRSVPDWPGQVMLGFYQADKKEMHRIYASYSPKPRIATVHEVQGETVKSVRLHRFDVRRRADGQALFDKASYVLVAMSRHTENFAYVSPRLGDLVEQWVGRGASLRRRAVAMEVESAGQSKEFS